MTTYPFQVPRGLAANRSANGAAEVGSHNPVDAAGAPVTVTLAAPGAGWRGAIVSVEKVDGSANGVTVTGTLRGASASVVLDSMNEVIEFIGESATSWRPVGDHRTTAAIQGLIDAALDGLDFPTSPVDQADIDSTIANLNLPTTYARQGSQGRADLLLGTAATHSVSDFDAAGAAASAQAAAIAASQPVDADLTAIAALSTTSYGRAFLGLADAAAARTAMALGSAATHAATDFDADHFCTALYRLSVKVAYRHRKTCHHSARLDFFLWLLELSLT